MRYVAAVVVLSRGFYNNTLHGFNRPTLLDFGFMGGGVQYVVVHIN